MSGSTIGVDRAGQGPPLVLLHGLGGERRVWRDVVELLADERELVSIDLPGFGGSDPLADGIVPTPAAIAQRLHAFFDDLGLDRPDIAGNSLGGWVALELAKRDAVSSVVGLCPAGLWTRPLSPKPSMMHTVARGLRPVLPALMRVRGIRRFALTGVVARPERISPRDALAITRAYADASDFVATNRAMRAGFFSGGEAIRAPVTLAWGEHDRMVSPRSGVVPNERTVVLSGCGHLPMLDDPALTARVLLDGSAATDGDVGYPTSPSR